MLRFFRKIRQDFLSKNRFGKYFLYALGEIVLVVIGILIALQIDNWNSEKKDRKAEKNYLSSLNTEFSANLESLESTIAENENLVKALDRLTLLFHPDTLDKTSEKQVAIFLNALATEVVYYPSQGVMSDIINSGNLKLIRNDRLRQKLASFDNALKRIENQENLASETKNSIMRITRRNGSFSNIFAELENNPKMKLSFRPSSNKILFTILELENDLELYKRITLATNHLFYATLKKDIEDILDMIEEDLSKE